MNYRLSFVLAILVTSTSASATIDPSKLVRVNEQTRQQCVEYYSYKGTMFCSTTALAKQTHDADLPHYERQHIVFDNRPWKMAWGKKTEDVTTVEYIPMGETINDWHELVTSQYFPDLQEQATPREFASKVIEGIRSAGFQPIITFIKETPDQVIFEFRIEKPEAQAQDEIQMITKGNDGLYVIHYVIKQPDMGNKQRDLWVANLINSSIRQ